MRNFAASQLMSRWQNAKAELDRCRQNPGDDEVHDLRVSLRRVTEALRLFETLLGPDLRVVRRRLRPLRRATGEVRDLDITLELALKSGRGAAHPVPRILAAQRELAVGQLSAQLAAPEGLGSPPVFGIPEKDGLWAPGDSPVANARAVLPEVARSYFNAGIRAVEPGRKISELHAFRIDSKHFRYTLEMFAPLYGPGLTTRAKHLRKVQQVLGEVNDCDTARRQFAIRLDAELEDWVERRMVIKRAEFTALWKDEFGGDTGEQWAAYLYRYARPPKA